MVGGTGVYLLQPFFTNNPALDIHIQGTGPDTRQDISSHVSAAPQLWLGYMNPDGLGVRGRWWYFHQTTNQAFSFAGTDPSVAVLSAEPLGSGVYVGAPSPPQPPAPPPPPGPPVGPFSMQITSKLELQVADIEAFQETSFCHWNVLLVRRLFLRQYRAGLRRGGDPGTRGGG